MKAQRHHPILKGAFWLLAGLLISLFVFAPIALMALSAFIVIVPALPFVIVPFARGTWQGRAEPEHARFRVSDVTPASWATARVHA